MASHSDEDAPILAQGLQEMAEALGVRRTIQDMQASLQRRAEKMTEERSNLITAGADGERVLFEDRARGLLIRRLEDDPDRVLRVSLGAPTWDPREAYLVFRGDPHKIHDLVKRAEKALRRLLE